MNRDELMNSAVEALRQGRVRDAQHLCRQVLDDDPEFLPALSLSGVVAAQENDHEAAIRAFSDILARNPGVFDAWSWLAIELRAAHRPQEAIEASQRMIQLAPDRFEGYNSLGMCLLEEQPRWKEAAQAFQRAIKLAPGMAMLHHNLGIALQRLGHASEAEGSFRTCIKLAPGVSTPYARLAELLSQQNRHRESSTLFRMAHEREPDSPSGLMNLAKALIDEERPEEAREVLERVVTADPPPPGALASLGHIQFLLGDLESARRTLDRSIERDPDAVRAYVDRVYGARTTAQDTRLIEAIQRQLGKGDLPEQEKADLEYALGKALDDLGDYAEAIKHYDEANRMMLTLVQPIDRKSHSARIDRIIQTYSAEAMSPPVHPPAHLQSDKPILIVGMIRSGTTLTEQVLSSHPEVGAAEEPRFWLEKGDSGFEGEIPSQEEFAWLASDYVAELERLAPGRPRVTDKMPLNFIFLGPIHLALPNARIIHCRRDPLDTCLSIYLTPFRGGLEFGHDRDTIVYTYKEYLRLMEHWRSVLPAGRFLEVDYEDLVANREAATRRMLEFCGLPWNEACLTPERNYRTVRTPSTWQVRQPIYRTSKDRWKNYEPWLGSLAELKPLQRSPDPGS